MSSTAFALDIGEHYVKVADVEKKKDHFNVKSAAFNTLAFNPYTTNAEEYIQKASHAIRQMVDDSRIKKRDVNIVIPDSQSYTRIFEMPLLTDKELMSAIKYQADQFIPIPIDKVSLDIHILSKNKEKQTTTILLVAASKSIIKHVIHLAEAASFTPMVIENETSAALRLVSEIDSFQAVSKEPGTRIYVNFGESSSSLYLYSTQKRLPLQVHNFSIGKNIFFRDIQANFTLNNQQIKDLIEKVGFAPIKSQYNLNKILASPMNEFVTEIKRFLISSKEIAESNVQDVVLFGEGTKFAGMDAKLKASLNLPVRMFDLAPYFEKNNVADYFVHDWPLMVSAVGSSLR